MSINGKIAIVIGAGFFGCAIVERLVESSAVSHIFVVDKSRELFSSASSQNQARIHQGYHYPRSIQTAYASRRRYEEFKNKWPKAVFSDFEHLYGVATKGSHVTAKQFMATMNAIGAPIREVSHLDETNPFNPHHIEKAFLVKEEAFNFEELKVWAQELLASRKVTYVPNVSAIRVRDSVGRSETELSDGSSITSDLVFNVTYAGLESIVGLAEDVKGKVKYELAFMALTANNPLGNTAITVMDGPFFSLMPYPALGRFQTLSHVEYTPLLKSDTPLEKSQYSFEKHAQHAVFDLMRRDASRFVPAVNAVEFVDGITTIKAVLRKSDRDDSRPILFLKHKLPGCFSVLGGKLDNVFDVLETITRELDL